MVRNCTFDAPKMQKDDNRDNWKHFWWLWVKIPIEWIHLNQWDNDFLIKKYFYCNADIRFNEVGSSG